MVPVQPSQVSWDTATSPAALGEELVFAAIFLFFFFFFSGIDVTMAVSS